MNASRAVLPPVARMPSSQANTTKQATTRARVTTGVCRVGLASRRGITGPLRSGLLGGLRAGLGWSAAGRAGGPRAGRRRRVRDGDKDRLVDPVLGHPDEGRRLAFGAGDDIHRAEVGPVGRLAGQAVLAVVRAVRLGQGDHPRTGSVEAVDVTLATGRAGRDDRVA